MGKIIVIEANTDGAGKQTQSEMLLKHLEEKGEKVISFSFPNYDSDSSYFVKKYLKGELGDAAKRINPYVVSTFFAIDRVLSYKEEIEKYYNDGYTIIFDRYVTSNMLYQATKIEADESEKEEKIDEFISWEEDLEYNKYGLPKPDHVIYLHIPIEISAKLRENRPLKTGDERDIHEEDLSYLKEVSNVSEYVSSRLEWTRIECSENGLMRNREDISQEIIEKIL